MDPTVSAQLAPYEPWLIIAAIFVLFILLRVTRRNLRQRVDEIGYRLFREKGLLIWFWLNAPGVILHELSHAFIVLLFRPFGFRITSIALFRIKPMEPRGSNGRIIRSGGRQSLQLGEVQYVRPQGKLVSYIGDGLLFSVALRRWPSSTGLPPATISGISGSNSCVPAGRGGHSSSLPTSSSPLLPNSGPVAKTGMAHAGLSSVLSCLLPLC